MKNEEALFRVAASINSELEQQSSMEVGKRIKHPKGYMVEVVDGAFLRNGRVSNFWSWRRVGEDGNPGKLESGYGW